MTQNPTLQLAADLATSTNQPILIVEAFKIASDLHDQGQLQHAEAILRNILQSAPKHALSLHLLGVITHQYGKTELAIKLLEKAVEIAPDEAQFLANLAEMFRQLNRLDEAISTGKKAIVLAPNLDLAQSNLGVAYYDQGDLENAQACQQRALAINPNMPAALNNLGSILRDKKDKAGAIAYFRKVMAVAPNYVESQCNLASMLTDNEEPEAAIKLLLPIIQAHPNYASAHCNIGNAFLVLEQFEKAVFGFNRALALNPNSVEACIGMAQVFQEQRNLIKALEMAERAVTLSPNKAEVYSLLGSIYGESGFPEKAEAAYAQALNLDNSLISAYLGRGHQLMENGDMAGAEADFRHVLSLEQDNLGARLALAQVSKVKPEDENMAALIQASTSLATLAETKALPLHFGLAKGYEDTKQYDLAFAHYQAGCQLKRKRIEYSTQNTEMAGENIRKFFTKENIDRLRGEGCDSSVPIFVLGMPRSGTTLTETIIASHPLVYGAGELNDILQVVNQPGNNEGYPLNLNGVTQTELRIMGERYVAELQTRAVNSSRITDKMPANFNFIGLIHLMLPHAKIVHVKRNPIDTCVSCYTRLFNKSQYQSYDLAEIGHYYRNYHQLMQHWREVLPTGAFYEIEYESLVADTEGEARALLQYCELEWDNACLDFHKTKRNIRTASVTQVRQPIYKTSVEKWRNYEKHLGPLLEALGDLVAK